MTDDGFFFLRFLGAGATSITDNTSSSLLDDHGRAILDGSQIPRLASADYADTLISLLPSGSVWPREADSAISQAMGAIALTFARCADRAVALLKESPVGGNLIELLPEWEASLGLPDPCSGPDPTIMLRQAHVRTRLAYSGGQSIPYFVAYAAALGHTVTITEFVPARADYLRADDPVLDLAWAHAWQVNVPALTVNYFTADQSYADEPLATWGYSSLFCELNRIKPAHTILTFEFGQPVTALWGTGRWGVDVWG